MKNISVQVCVIGAGAGGSGCVLRLIKNGIRTAVADRNPDFGGTMVYSGVDGFEPGVSLDGMHRQLYEKMSGMENGCHVVERVPNYNLFCPENGSNWDMDHYGDRPWGLSVPTGRTYEDTLSRGDRSKGVAGMKRFQFEPDAMRAAINSLMEPYRHNLSTFFGFSFEDCVVEEGKLKAVILSDGSEQVQVSADYFVDASGDIILARKAGCDFTFGSEGKDAYKEPSAGKEPSDRVNAVTYVFRIRSVENKEHRDGIPEEYQGEDIGQWQEERMRTVVSCFSKYPNGDINVNMLPTMEGREYFALKDRADRIGRARVWAYWKYLQEEKNMQGYTLTHIYDAGIRESFRLVGRYVLTETDCRTGILRQPKIGKTIAIADHALDIHGDSGMCAEVEQPYEIPIECTMTKEYDNLYVACRGASFSHIAGASVRLNRTMLSLGEGVGEHIAGCIAGA